MKKTNAYPMILVHGFLCWGDDDPINQVFPCFGMFNSNAKADIEEAGVPCFTPAVGPFNNMWARACELYAYIKGGRVDYGKVHAERYGMERFGPTYEGVVKNWGELDDEGKLQKVNLVGHSFGGPTVRTLIHLLAEGSEEERAATEDRYLYDLFRGGKQEWIHSCTTLAATHNGVTLPDAGRPVVKPMAAVCYGLGMLFSGTPVARFYRWHLERYGISNPDFHLKFNWKKIKHLVDLEEGNIFWELSNEGGQKMTETYKTYDNIYYFSYYGCRTQKAPFGLPGQIPTKKQWPPFYLFSLFEGFYKSPAYGPEWQPNDGIVNVPAAKYPLREPHEAFQSNDACKPGVWYYFPVEDKDHTSYMGVQETAEDYKKFMLEITDRVTDLPVL